MSESPFKHARVNDTPLQIAGQEEIIREYTLAGPDSGRDCRMILDAETLGLLLDIARSSNTRRVVLHGAGIRLKVRRTNSGYVYETLHLTSKQPVPENISSTMKIEAPLPIARDLIRGFRLK